ncbi:pyridoxamine 5'-phosphate oxidase family protein [Streptomyces sp. NPDC093544]|jgi:predicted pyridoxine 5'-phosphate oxidase superfamily flavin-nucleotide-binding protein|uniref:pyridoxamine 5'-phosphate oxidase family protein n=1 Tax=Streptomyces sp. NPDC093544 TaxID=3155200 RepID=UPI00341DC119
MSAEDTENRLHMGKVYERLDGRTREFIEKQPVFFVATAPADGGRVNVSPKGYADTFTVLDDTTVAYLDLDGSGIETVAHVRENGRITLMFCGFERRAVIVRLYGTGRVVTPHDDRFQELLARFGSHPGVRSVIVVDVDRIADSCGWGVPMMTHTEDRSTLDRWAVRQDVQATRAYRARHNRTSIDGIPGLSPGESDPVTVRS